VALDPRWGFERVFSLEPAEDCQSLLRRFREPRLVVDGRGLSNETRTAELYGAGLLGASVYADKPQGGGGEVDTIALVRASDWIREHTSQEDDVYLKMNCEGSEADILDDLLDSDELVRIRSIYVDFDIRKIPSQEHRRQRLEKRLVAAGIPYLTLEGMGKSGTDAVKIWLNASVEKIDCSLADRMRYAFGLYLPPYLWARAIARSVLPGSAFQWVSQRFGRRGGARARS
jgi:FkbM family methyltransferase